MNDVQLFRKRPVTIEAMQWDGTIEGGKKLHDWIGSHGGVSRWSNETPQRPYIETLEGDMKVSENDWVIRGIQGEFYPCKPDIFDGTYESVVNLGGR